MNVKVWDSQNGMSFLRGNQEDFVVFSVMNSLSLNGSLVVSMIKSILVIKLSNRVRNLALLGDTLLRPTFPPIFLRHLYPHCR